MSKLIYAHTPTISNHESLVPFINLTEIDGGTKITVRETDKSDTSCIVLDDGCLRELADKINAHLAAKGK